MATPKGEKMKKYTFNLVVHEGCDEFWESLNDKTGCDEVYKMVKLLLEGEGYLCCDGEYQNCEFTLIEYNNNLSQ